MNRTFLRPWFLTFFKSVFKYFLIACFLSSNIIYRLLRNPEQRAAGNTAHQFTVLSIFRIIISRAQCSNLREQFSSLFLRRPVRDTTNVIRSSLIGIVVRDICSKFGSFRKPLGQGHMRLRDLEICQKLM